MRALTEGARALAYVAAAHSDIAHRHADAAVQAEHQAIYEYLVPVVKGWSTEISIEVASLGVQVHGGMGFIEETGAAQYYRDARILTIYEGTTAIQANDLIGRKTLRDGGAVAKSILGQIDRTLGELQDCALVRFHPGIPVVAQAARDRPRGAGKRGGFHARKRQKRSECGVCWRRVLPEAGWHRAGGLAICTCPAGSR